MIPQLRTRLEQRVRAILTGWGQSLQQNAGALHALSPLAILARGYSITRRWPQMQLLRKADDVAPGDAVHIRLASGDIVCEVRQLGEELQPGNPTGADKPSRWLNKGPRIRSSSWQLGGAGCNGSLLAGATGKAAVLAARGGRVEWVSITERVLWRP